MNNFFLHFSKLFSEMFFSEINNAKIISNYFLCFHITIIVSITLKSNFTKEKRIYGHIWTYFIYNYIL